MMFQALSQATSSSCGMARAIVRANNDPEKRGRLKVEYPWFSGESAQLPSEWARICLPYASANSGTWLIPEIGDEVVVMFENGNLDSPIILGALYSGKNSPPASGKAGDFNSDNKNNLKFIRTRSGHQICFDDSGQGGISIQDAFGNSIVLKNGEVVIQSASKISIGEGASHALVLGDLFQQLFNTHTHPIPTGSSGPPSAPMQPTMLSQKVKTV